MTVIKRFIDGEWQTVVVGREGDQGPAGPGVATGGTTGQVLAKASNTDFDTTWVNRVASPDVDTIEAISQTDYDLLSPPVATTLYVITGP